MATNSQQVIRERNGAWDGVEVVQWQTERFFAGSLDLRERPIAKTVAIPSTADDGYLSRTVGRFIRQEAERLVAVAKSYRFWAEVDAPAGGKRRTAYIEKHAPATNCELETQLGAINARPGWQAPQHPRGVYVQYNLEHLNAVEIFAIAASGLMIARLSVTADEAVYAEAGRFARQILDTVDPEVGQVRTA